MGYSYSLDGIVAIDAARYTADGLGMVYECRVISGCIRQTDVLKLTRNGRTVYSDGNIEAIFQDGKEVNLALAENGCVTLLMIGKPSARRGDFFICRTPIEPSMEPEVTRTRITPDQIVTTLQTVIRRIVTGCYTRGELTQRQLATVLETNQYTVQRMLQGDCILSYEATMRFARIMGISIDVSFQADTVIADKLMSISLTSVLEKEKKK